MLFCLVKGRGVELAVCPPVEERKERGTSIFFSIATRQRGGKNVSRERERERKKESQNFSPFFSVFFFLHPPPSLLKGKAGMSLAATLRRYATPTNVTAATMWGATALTGAIFLVQVSFFFRSCFLCRRSIGLPFFSSSSCLLPSPRPASFFLPLSFVSRTERMAMTVILLLMRTIFRLTEKRRRNAPVVQRRDLFFLSPLVPLNVFFSLYQNNQNKNENNSPSTSSSARSQAPPTRKNRI